MLAWYKSFTCIHYSYENEVKTSPATANVFFLHQANINAGLEMPAVRASWSVKLAGCVKLYFSALLTGWISCAVEKGMGQHEESLSPSKAKELLQNKWRIVPKFIITLVLVCMTSKRFDLGAQYDLYMCICVKELTGQQLPESLQQWGWHRWGDFQSPFPKGQTGHLHGRCRSDPDSSVQSGHRSQRSTWYHF